MGNKFKFDRELFDKLSRAKNVGKTRKIENTNDTITRLISLKGNCWFLIAKNHTLSLNDLETTYTAKRNIDDYTIIVKETMEAKNIYEEYGITLLDLVFYNINYFEEYGEDND